MAAQHVPARADVCRTGGVVTLLAARGPGLGTSPTVLSGSADRLHVGLHLPAVLRRGLEPALVGAGHRVDVPEDVEHWARDADGRRLLVTVDTDQALDVLDRLRAVAPDVRSLVLLSGVSGYGRVLPRCTGAVPVDGDVDDVLTAVQVAVSGFTLLPVPVARQLVSSGADPSDAPQVSTRERSWLRQLAAGTTVAGLARSDNRSEREMYRLLALLYQRFGVRTRTEALLCADRFGLLDDPAATRGGR